MVVSKARSRQTGPLERFRVGFAEFLEGQGFGSKPIELHLAVFSQLSRWLGAHGLGPDGLTEDVAAAFMAERRAAGYTWHTSVRSLGPLRAYLGSVGTVPAVPAPSLAEQLVDAYVDHVREERGLAEGSIALYVTQVRRLLGVWWSDGKVAPHHLDGEDVLGALRQQAAGMGPAATSTLLCALRSFLRFLQATGRTRRNLLAAVPSMADRRRQSIPRWVDAGVVARMVAACDVDTATGRRDRAILLLLARVGLRAGEVAGLGLDDVDWIAGELVVAGKGRRVERLPLPVDVGEAIVAYLLQGRPSTPSRGLLITSLAPYEPLSGAAVKSVVYRACDRAGLPRVGPHRLRHTVATQALWAGATMSEVAQLLRHRRVETTALYAKVDRATLAMLARPWPGGSR